MGHQFRQWHAKGHAGHSMMHSPVVYPLPLQYGTHTDTSHGLHSHPVGPPQCPDPYPVSLQSIWHPMRSHMGPPVELDAAELLDAEAVLELVELDAAELLVLAPPALAVELLAELAALPAPPAEALELLAGPKRSASSLIVPHPTPSTTSPTIPSLYIPTSRR